MRKIIASVMLMLTLVFSGCSVTVESPKDEPSKTVSTPSATVPAPSTTPKQQAPRGDENLFIQIVRDKIPALAAVDDETLIKTGEQVCIDFSKIPNITDKNLVDYITGFSKGTKGRLSIVESAAFVASAGYALCPETLKPALDHFRHNSNGSNV